MGRAEAEDGSSDGPAGTVVQGGGRVAGSFDPGLMRTVDRCGLATTGGTGPAAVGVAGSDVHHHRVITLSRDLRVSAATGRNAVGVAMAAPSGPVAEVASDVNQRGNGCAGVFQRTCVLYLSNGGGP